ncbi:MAG: hypothetical protein ACRDSP_02610 [Pseudonocardiaceae bacterium]
MPAPATTAAGSGASALRRRSARRVDDRGALVLGRPVLRRRGADHRGARADGSVAVLSNRREVTLELTGPTTVL